MNPFFPSVVAEESRKSVRTHPELCLSLTYKSTDKGLATRINSQKCINALASVLPGFMGGSADLAPSNMIWDMLWRKAWHCFDPGGGGALKCLQHVAGKKSVMCFRLLFSPGFVLKWARKKSAINSQKFSEWILLCTEIKFQEFPPQRFGMW